MSHDARAVLANAELSSFMEEMMLGAQLDTRRRAARHAPDEMRERDQQIHLPISGSASQVAAWASVHVNFDLEFIGACVGRNTNLNWPHFTYGYVITTPNPVAIMAHVSGWDQGDGWKTTGATVKWCAFAPDAPAVPYPFAGSLHLTFQGYGSPPEIDSSELGDDLGSSVGAPGAITAGDDS
jgi:hypothetical protein